MASELSANNPDLIESLRRNMGNRPQPNSDDNNSTSSLLKKKQIIFCKYFLFFYFIRFK